MKTVIFSIFLTITLVLSQGTVPPCKWTLDEWTMFKQCIGTQANEINERCVRQQTSGNDWITMRNTICSSQSKMEEIKKCLTKDVKIIPSLMICSDKVEAHSSNRAG